MVSYPLDKFTKTISLFDILSIMKGFFVLNGRVL